MVTMDVLQEINSLQPDEQTMVLSLVKSFRRRNDNRTVAQKAFERECAKYQGRDMSMEEIDAIIHGED